MKPQTFELHRAHSIAEALALAQEHGDDCVLLAGGQSLMPMLNMRLVGSATVLDISGVTALRGIDVHTDVILIGALTRHVDIERSVELKQVCPLLVDAIRHVAHAAIRNRGTIGGSACLAHPSAELPGCLLALDAQIVLASAARGERRVGAEDFFRGVFTTARQADEVMLRVEIPRRMPTLHWFGEYSRRQGDFCVAGLALHAHPLNGALVDARAVLIGVEDRPIRLRALEGSLLHFDRASARNSVSQVVAGLTGVGDDLHHSAAAKRHIATELVLQGLEAFARRAGEPQHA
jgi:carbon-monoxide dehydrogenase medium subunit